MASKKVTVSDVFPDTKKIFSMGVMLVRGPVGFRKLDYEFVNKINPKKIVQKCAETGFNSIGIVVKDTDGACIWDTQIGWNPTGRDLTGEFCDYAQQYNLKIAASFTNMNDAYQGYLHPERVSVHKNGKVATHDEGEMRVDLPAGKSIADMKEIIPFLTDKFQTRTSAGRDNRGEGYVPLTSFMCPTSPHVDYLCNLIRELVGKYPISGVMADYIRFDGSFTDLCQCPRCNRVFYKLFPGKKIGSEAWRNFREMVIARFGRKFVEAVHSVKPDVFTGYFQLPGPRFLFTRPRIAQDWKMLSDIFDVTIPMDYPYLMGTADDGKYWGVLGNVSFYYARIMRKMRWHDMTNTVLVITNSVECNAKEMLRQMRAFDFGNGIGMFKYYGTKKSQWVALKKYLEKEAWNVNTDPTHVYLNRRFDRVLG